MGVISLVSCENIVTTARDYLAKTRTSEPSAKAIQVADIYLIVHSLFRTHLG